MVRVILVQSTHSTTGALSSFASSAVLVLPATWAVVYFVSGVCNAGVLVILESWLNDRASNETRGRLLSIYMLVITFGLGFGQLLLGIDDPLNATLFILVGILISLAVVPIALFRIPVPEETIPVEFSVAALVRTAPLGALAVVMSGAADSAVLSLGAVYGTRVGMNPGNVGVFMAASLIGAAATQYPLGYLSDRLPRRRVVLAVAAGAVTVAVVGAVAGPDGVWLFILVAAYGSLAFPMYSLAVSLINDVIPANQLVAAAAGIVFIYGVGSVAGPLVVSVLMEVLGPAGYFWGLAAFFLPLAAYAFARIIFTARPMQRRFVSLPYRSSTAAALLAESSDEE